MPVRSVRDIEPIVFPEYFDWQNSAPQSVLHKYEDVYPDPLAQSTTEIGARVREFMGVTKDAGKMVVYLLTGSFGKTWTRQEIGNELYDHSERDASRRTHNAGCLLTNHYLGYQSTIPAGLREVERELGLSEGDIIIQVGRRFELRPNGVRFGKGERIARAIVRGSAQPEFLGDGTYEDDWTEDSKKLEPDNLKDPVAPYVSEEAPSETQRVEPKPITEEERRKYETFIADAEGWVELMVANETVKRPLYEVADSIRGTELYDQRVGTVANYKNALAARIINMSEANTCIVVEPHRAVAMALLPRYMSLLANRASQKEALLVLKKLVASHRALLAESEAVAK
jgi:hypothetical protein